MKYYYQPTRLLLLKADRFSLKSKICLNPIKDKTKTNGDLARFPALRLRYMYLLRVLIGSEDYLCPL